MLVTGAAARTPCGGCGSPELFPPVRAGQTFSPRRRTPFIKFNLIVYFLPFSVNFKRAKIFLRRRFFRSQPGKFGHVREKRARRGFRARRDSPIFYLFSPLHWNEKMVIF
jgi:hypothetical protein